MAAFPLAIVGAAIGGTLSFFQAQARNAALRRAALLSQQRLNKMMAHVRFDAALETERASRDAQTALGARTNVSPEHQGSLEAAALQVDGIFSDTLAISEERDRRLEAFGFEKMNIATEATNQSVNVALATAQGAFGGVTSGLSFGLSLDQAFSQRRQAALSSEAGDISLERARGATSGATVGRDFRLRMQGNFLEDNDRSRSALDDLNARLRSVGRAI